MQHMNKTNIYQLRRNTLAEQIFAKTGGGIAVISTAPELARNRDSEFPYRHDSDFYYLTGFEEPGATLVMKISGNGKSYQQESHLFCRPKDLEREIWDGIRLGPEAAPETLGIEFAHSNLELDKKLADLLADQDAIYVRLAEWVVIHWYLNRVSSIFLEPMMLVFVMCCNSDGQSSLAIKESASFK